MTLPRDLVNSRDSVTTLVTSFGGSMATAGQPERAGHVTDGDFEQFESLYENALSGDLTAQLKQARTTEKRRMTQLIKSARAALQDERRF